MPILRRILPEEKEGNVLPPWNLESGSARRDTLSHCEKSRLKGRVASKFVSRSGNGTRTWGGWLLEPPRSIRRQSIRKLAEMQEGGLSHRLRGIGPGSERLERLIGINAGIFGELFQRRLAGE